MKSIKVFIISMLCATGVFAQYLPDLPMDNEGNIVVSEVVDIDATARELLRRGRIYFAEKYHDANNVLQLVDSSTLIGKANVPFTITSGSIGVGCRMHFTLKIEVKEGHYRYRIYNVYYTADGSTVQSYPAALFSQGAYYNRRGRPHPVLAEYKRGTLEGIDLIIKGLKGSMAQAGTF